MALLYSRELPGGGRVMIEETRRDGLDEHRARVVVERRSEPHRREGHEPPVIAEAAGDASAIIFRDLYAIASDNVAVARGLIRWEAGRRGA